MKILLLEDSSNRIEKFKELFKNQELFICSDIQTAKETCLCNRIALFLLDHDLDGRMWQDSNEENTGYQFVKWIIDNEIGKESLFYIHSMNVIGANRMLNLLKDNNYDGIWQPFHLWKI